VRLTFLRAGNTITLVAALATRAGTTDWPSKVILMQTTIKQTVNIITNRAGRFPFGTPNPPKTRLGSKTDFQQCD